VADIFSKRARLALGKKKLIMINLFRNTRRKLADDNRPLMYMRYAIGEIVLVVVGILIALQINTWNEERKLEKERFSILENLKDDLTNDIGNYKMNIHRLEEKQKIANEVLKLFENIPLKIDSANTARKLLVLGYIEDHNPNFATYNEIQGSGKLSILRSKELKTDLANYRSTFDNFKAIGANWNEDLKDYERIVSGYFSGSIELQNLDFENNDTPQNKNLKFNLQEMSKDNELITRIKHITYFTKIQMNIKKYALSATCDSIISKIDKELEMK
jgi:hypothetical protein